MGPPVRDNHTQLWQCWLFLNFVIYIDDILYIMSFYASGIYSEPKSSVDTVHLFFLIIHLHKNLIKITFKVTIDT